MLLDFKVNLELYKVFYLTALMGSMTKAAEALYMGQPAVSKSIKAIEKQLGVSLFVRGAKGLALTSEGAVLFENVSQALEQIQLAESTVQNMSKHGPKITRIEVCAMQFKLLVLPRLTEFFETCDRNAFEITPTTDTYSSLDLLEQGKIDCCILTKPVEPTRFEFVRLFTFHDYLMGAPDYIARIREKGQDITQSATLISIMNKSIMRSYEQQRLKDQHFKNKMKVTSMDHTIDLVKLGYGVGFIAEELVAEELAGGTLAKVGPDSKRHAREVGFLLNKNAKPDENLRQFIDFYSRLYAE